MPTSPYPQPAPTITGTNITVSLFLQSPPRVQRAVEALTLQRFVSDVIFGAGPPVTGGAVVHDQVLVPDVFLDRDVQEIAPGAEFPLLTSPEVAPLVALARKWGGEVFLTDEAIRRDNRQRLNREMTRLRNTIVRRVDTLGMAALRAAPIINQVASGSWAVAATDTIADLVTGAGAINGPDMGYIADTVVLNPREQESLLKDKDIRDAMPRERDDSLIRTGNLGRLLNMDFIVTNRVNPGEVFLLARGVIGGISDEVPLYARPIPDERREVVFIHGARVPAVYVTDPKAAVRITGA